MSSQVHLLRSTAQILMVNWPTGVAKHIEALLRLAMVLEAPTEAMTGAALKAQAGVTNNAPWSPSMHARMGAAIIAAVAAAGDVS